MNDRIAAAARAAGRLPQDVTLVAVSKTFPASAIVEARAAGQRAFGENYVQEALDKMAELARLDIDGHAARPCGDVQPGAGGVRPIEDGAASPAEPPLRPLVWHYIGPIQSNKTRPIAEAFAWVHGVDRQKIAQRLSDARPAALAPLQVCLQVNVSGEASKSGIAPEAALELAQSVAGLPRLRLRGLMAIPEPTDDILLQQARFRRLRELRDQITARGIPLDTLSMGMSADMEAAVAEGATMVRIGTAIFGARPAIRPLIA